MNPPASDAVAAAVSGWLSAGYVAPGRPLIVACSGGADSLALAAAVRAVAVSVPAVSAVAGMPAPSAVIVDHGLQPGSAQVARTAAGQLRALGYADVEVIAVQVAGPGGTEAAARDARYRALADAASRTGAAVLLAHTADDQAETVLLGLARGSGPRSIAGMRPWREPWGRPLLGVRRSDTEHACAALGLDPWQDPHNADPSFTRVRLRREVIPLLDEVLGGGVVGALSRTAELMADDLTALDEIAAAATGSAIAPDGALDATALAGVPSAVARRVLRCWLAGITTLTFQHLVRLENLVIHGRSGQAVRLPGDIDVTRRGTVLRITAAGGAAPGIPSGGIPSGGIPSGAGSGGR